MSCCYNLLLPLLVLSLTVLPALSQVSTNASDAVQTSPKAPHLAFPVTVSTNAKGVVQHHFPMKPVITNMVAATNELAQLKAQQDALEAELKKAADEGGSLKKTIRTDYLNIVGVMTNFPARNEDGKKLHERIQALETELKGLKQEFQKLLDEDESYKQARAKVEADREAMKSFEEKLAELRRKRTDVGSKVWQLQTVVSQTLKAEAEERAKAEADQQVKPGEKAQENPSDITP